MEQVRDIVVLIPGFLGFDALPGLRYFHNDFVKGLRSALPDARVIVTDTIPIGSLVVRQDALMKQLQEQLGTHAHAQLHLIGHSTGGVDARLLLARTPLKANTWAQVGYTDAAFPADEVRKRIAHVIGIASPHRGTWLVAHRDVGELSKRLSSLIALLTGDPRLLLSVLFDTSTLGLLLSAPRNLSKIADFVEEIVNNRALIHDLHPYVITGDQPLEDNGCGAEQPIDPGHQARLLSVVVMVARRRTGLLARALNSVPLRTDVVLYRWLRKRCELCDTDAHRLLSKLSNEDRSRDTRAIATLKHWLDRRKPIAGPDRKPPEINDRVGDAIVTAVRQLFRPEDPEELLGVVFADHLDVIGHFDRPSCLLPSWLPVEHSGLIKSGSDFGIDQESELVQLLASAIRSNPAT